MHADARIIAGSLVDAKNVGVHKSLRLIIDVPQELALQVIEKLGWPTMANPIPVAVARMESERITEGATEAVTEAVHAQLQTQTEPARESAPEPAPVRALRNCTWQAVKLCRSPAFWLFLRERGRNAIKDEEGAKAYVYELCGVTTRADIKPGTEAEQRWNLLHSAFIAWQEAPAVVGAA